MNQNQETIEADLRGLIDGEVRCDDVFTQMYASDASIYQVRPLGVIRPRHTEDVIACVKYAAENHLAIHARGAGTGLAGESLGSGLVIDFSHFMRRIVNIQSDTVRVQPGLTLAQLNRQLVESGRHFGPDPATREVTTMGSVMAIDASGSHWLQYGSARQHVVEMRLVLADGSCIDVSRTSRRTRTSELGNGRIAQITNGLTEILDRDAALIAEHTPQTCVNRCGYHLSNVITEDAVDIPQLIVGSEG